MKKNKNILSLTFITLLMVIFTAPFVFKANLNPEAANILNSYISVNGSLK